MATAADLEGFERAYRLRSAADDGLLRQVFGEKGLAELAATRPALLETARAYFPHLTSSTYERLAREPDALQLEKDRCEREMEQLAVQNYGAFIGSAKVTQAVRQEVVDIQKHLDAMADTLAPMQSTIQEFQVFAAGLVTRRAELRNVLQNHGMLLELLELPQLLDACVRNQMYEESLELLAYCGNKLQAHEARGEEIPVLSRLKDQIAVQRANLQSSLVAQLATDLHLPACVRVVSFLRRTQRHSEEELRSLFIEHRGSFLEKQKQQVEQLRGSRGSVVAALKNAADLLRTHVYDIGTQYQALFQQDDGPLVAWLSEQIAWLTGLLRCHVLPHRADAQAARQAGGPLLTGHGQGAATAVRIDAAALMTILRQCAHASTALKRLGGHFFPAVAWLFDARMEHHVCEMLDVALLTFHAELGRFDWVPSTALTGGSPAAPSAPGGPPGWLHPQALELTRHRPLAVFTNELVQVFNELRQCPLHGLRLPVVRHFTECLSGGVNMLRSVQGSQAFQPATAKATEFTRLCRHFADILVPLMAAHLETVFGPAARLDTTLLVSGMSPDLLPLEAEYPLPPFGSDGEEVPLPMAPAPTASAGPPTAAVPTEAVHVGAVDTEGMQVDAVLLPTDAGAEVPQTPEVVPVQGAAIDGVAEGSHMLSDTSAVPLPMAPAPTASTGPPTAAVPTEAVLEGAVDTEGVQVDAVLLPTGAGAEVPRTPEVAPLQGAAMDGVARWGEAVVLDAEPLDQAQGSVAEGSQVLIDKSAVQ